MSVYYFERIGQSGDDTVAKRTGALEYAFEQGVANSSLDPETRLAHVIELLKVAKGQGIDSTVTFNILYKTLKEE